MKILPWFFIILIFLLLTVITQIGGLAFLISLVLVRNKSKFYLLKRIVIFLIIYVLSVFWLVPYLAKLSGREKIIESEFISPAFALTKWFNRNYVRPELNALLADVSQKANKKYPGVKLVYLDANFPFFDGFPLLPHLSHNDGRKLDLSFLYSDSNGKMVNDKLSVSGYGVFEEPLPSEQNTTTICKNKGYWQYDYPKWMTFGQSKKDLKFSVEANRFLLNELLKHPNLQKLFIEPHLVKRLQLSHPKIRFHGCKAVRHDDHIHIQVN